LAVARPHERRLPIGSGRKRPAVECSYGSIDGRQPGNQQKKRSYEGEVGTAVAARRYALEKNISRKGHPHRDPSASLGGCDFFGAPCRINRVVGWMRL
jgi:hypothetical protein